MAKSDFSIDVDVNLSVTDKTVDRCLRILEMWLEDNPQYDIVGERHPLLKGGERVILKLHCREFEGVKS